jgi:hypothetical protein
MSAWLFHAIESLPIVKFGLSFMATFRHSLDIGGAVGMFPLNHLERFAEYEI